MVRKNDYDGEGAAFCWKLIKRGVWTHDAIPNAAHQLLIMRYDVVHDMNEAYGYTEETSLPRFMPTPRDVSNMLTVWYWLNDLRKQDHGSRDFKLLVCRARAVPWWKLSQRWHKSERTVKRWHGAAVAWVYLANREEVQRLK